MEFIASLEAVRFWANSIWINLAIAGGSIVLSEIVRDLYHLAGHHVQPLQTWHTMHHKVFRPDLTPTSMEAYREAEWHNDVPEAIAMVMLSGAIAFGVAWYGGYYAAIAGCLYSAFFLTTAVSRANGLLLFTDLTHKPGDLSEIPSQWLVNRTYHWRHHFDRGEAYFSGTLPLFDKLLGTCLSLKGKTVAVTGASGAMGQALIAELTGKGAKVLALTTSATPSPFFAAGVEVLAWQPGAETAWRDRLAKVDILILNHGVNVYGARDPEAIRTSFEVNTWSVWRWMELFLETVTESKHWATKEVWVNTSEAEVNPAFSPLYELSKRTLGDLVTLRRLDAPCVVRKLILGPFKSKLNPFGVMSPAWVAWAIVALAQRDFRNIIVTVNPLTYLFFPFAEVARSLYFRLFSQSSRSL